MPAHYTHYRFGNAAIALFPPEIRRTVRQFRQLYEVGLQGPDPLFYHNILFRDKIVSLGLEIHLQSGEEFFTRSCEFLRQEPNDAATAYLIGVLAHYCLDSVLHPFVLDQTAEGAIGHVELETEFDRYLLQLDGKRQPNTFDLSAHIRLTKGECATAARFYPPATPAALRRSVRGMASSLKLLAMPNGNLRRIVENGAGSRLRQHFMGRSPNKNCAHLNEPMLALYDQALAELPALAEALLAHLSQDTPLGTRFETTFNG